MQKKRFTLIVLWMLVCSAISAEAQVSIGIGLPNVSIGINLPLYPELVPVEGYPVYYAPQVNGNYFFYDGMYWVFQNDNWYASSWYNGPWGFVEPEVVPLFVLRIPVRYYRQPPVYFRTWQSDAPPRWGQHWGNGWEQRRRGWDRWQHNSVPSRAPLPVYQRQYSQDRYPRVEQQQQLRSQSYRYQPRDKVVRQHFKQQERQKAPAAAQRGRQEASPARSPRQEASPARSPRQQSAPADSRSQAPQRDGENAQRSAPDQPSPQQRGPAAHEQRQQPEAPDRVQQQAPRAQGQKQSPHDKGESKEPNRGHKQEQNKDEERGRGRNN